MNQTKRNKQYLSNKNVNKSSKKLVINEYNYKSNNNNINKGNYNKYYK